MLNYGVDTLKFAIKKLRPDFQERTYKFFKTTNVFSCRFKSFLFFTGSARSGFVGWTPLHILSLRGRNTVPLQNNNTNFKRYQYKKHSKLIFCFRLVGFVVVQCVQLLLRMQADPSVQTAEFHLQSGSVLHTYKKVKCKTKSRLQKNMLLKIVFFVKGMMYELSRTRGTVSMRIESENEFPREDIVDEGLFPLHLVHFTIHPLHLYIFLLQNFDCRY